jgi:hypothetical protein
MPPTPLSNLSAIAKMIVRRSASAVLLAWACCFSIRLFAQRRYEVANRRRDPPGLSTQGICWHGNVIKLAASQES